MQVLIAYALDSSEDEALVRLDRVQRYYERLWRVRVTRQGSDAGRVGMHVWDASDSHCLWPAWQAEPDLGVATVYHPIGFENVVGQIPAERAALPLGRALLGQADLAAELSPPFVIGTLEPRAGRVTLFTDFVGLGHLFELRFPGGWVWSNRPAAACLFGGVRAEADSLGWRMFAATGAFMGESTPFERVFMVPASTQVGYDTSRGRVERSAETLATWAANPRGDPLLAKRVDELAEALRERVRSLPRMWSNSILADLSGGRDSRLVAAALLSAGVDIRLQTNGVVEGEAGIAERLVALLPTRIEHRVARPLAEQSDTAHAGTPTLERALGWHRYQEGLRPSTYLPERPPEGLRNLETVRVGGAAGEIARGLYYPGDLTELSGLPYSGRLRAFEEQLAGRLIQRGVGLSPSAREAAGWQVRRVLIAAARLGLDDAKALNYFYTAERLRHWGTAAGANGTVSPLLSPEFVRAAFDLTPEQHRDNALHEAVTARLMPVWSDVPYYQRPPGTTSVSLRPRLASAPDRDSIDALVSDADMWADGYDVTVVQREWLSLDRQPSAAAERMMQRVIWRAVFSDYLAEVNGEGRPTRSESSLSLRGSLPRRGPVRRGRRLTASVLRKAMRVVEPA